MSGLRAPYLLCGQCTIRAFHAPATRISSPHYLVTSKALPHRRSFHTSDIPLQSSPLQSSKQTFAGQQRRSIHPVNPASLGKPQAAKQYARSRAWLRRLAWATAIVGTVYVFDRYFLYSSLTRSTRTFKAGLVAAIDYKINFRPHPPFAKSVEDVHLRNAKRLFDLLQKNGSLYIKIGQAIAMQSAVLPEEFQTMFSRMFDDAMQDEWKDVDKVIRAEFGKSPEELFGVIEHKARGSASIAQVHWARLPDGREVAVKVQKRAVQTQVGFDLFAFKVMARIYTWWFDLPLYNMVPYINERLKLETDFVNEANNGEKMRAFIEGESRLRDKVYVPKVHRELSSTRIMTAEWIEGVRLWDKKVVAAPWRGGVGDGTPGCYGQALDRPGAALIADNSQDGKLKPARDEWKGRDKSGGLGLSLRSVGQILVDLFSAQMFLWGVVHCDPHPSNVYVRRKPATGPFSFLGLSLTDQTQLVLLDHGLYIELEPKFRHEYALFWKSLMTFDNKTIRDIAHSWGIGDPDVFASFTQMKPYTGAGEHGAAGALREQLAKAKDDEERRFLVQQRMRRGVHELLQDEEKWPKALLFLGRNLRIVQGNNQYLGSPVNRLAITGSWASRALADSPDLPLAERARNWGRHIIFTFVMFGTDIFFYVSKVRQTLGLGGGMEDDIEAQMRNVAKGMGVELNHGVFEG